MGLGYSLAGTAGIDSGNFVTAAYVKQLESPSKERVYFPVLAGHRFDLFTPVTTTTTQQYYRRNRTKVTPLVVSEIITNSKVVIDSYGGFRL